MTSNYTLDAYRSHELNIAMRTSSGDVIKMDFLNEQSTSIKTSQNNKSSQSSMHFSSMQAFQFSMETNGIDAQDQKEIDAFMETAKPYIDKFLKELSEDAPNTPVTKLAHQIAGAFEPTKLRNENEKNSIKTNIVKMFDKTIAAFEPPKQLSPEEMMEKILKSSQKLLEQTLKEFDNFNKELYA